MIKKKEFVRAYGLDEIALVPSAITLDPDDVNIGTTIAGIHLKVPIIAETEINIQLTYSRDKIAFVFTGGIQGTVPPVDTLVRQVTSQKKHPPVQPDSSIGRPDREAGIGSERSLSPEKRTQEYQTEDCNFHIWFPYRLSILNFDSFFHLVIPSFNLLELPGKTGEQRSNPPSLLVEHGRQ